MRKHVRELEKYRIYLIIAWFVGFLSFLTAGFIFTLIHNQAAAITCGIACFATIVFGCLPFLAVETLRDVVEQMAINEETPRT